MKLYKKILLGASITLAMASIANAKDTNKVIIATTQTVQTLNPHNASITLDMSVASAVYENLFKFDKNLVIVPVLATGYQVSEDAKTYTIQLRDGIKFSDGTDFNAEAVKFNFDHEISNKLRRASLLTEVDNIEVISPTELKISLKTPSNVFINNITHPSQGMISPTAIKKYGDDISKHPVGTGRYLFNKWVRGSSVSFTANPNYWGGDVAVKDLEFRPVAEAGSRLAMLKSGQAQMILKVPTTLKRAVEGDKKLEIKPVPSIIARYYALNTQNKILGNIKVRQALNYAINKPAMIKVTYGGSATQLTSIIPDRIETYTPQPEYKYDVEKAKSLLKEAGYPNGFKATLWSKNSTESMRNAQFLQQQLSDINVDINIIPRDVASHYAAADDLKNNSTKPIIIDGGWSSSSATADWAIRPIFETGASSNYALYSNTEVDKLIDRARKTTDKKQKLMDYQSAQKIIWSEAPYIFTTVDIQLYGKDKRLEGIELLPDGSLSVGNIKYSSK
ncbi:hypothetical protein E2R68_08525 [Psychromonas sp. RZ22]|uniref:ABC transporter substrate-binding protein n=1 Tax=Psychromonas algarum TaxID=2555643 RepID=UPI001067B952|nr:ABC transporter substrate-binding protein [Psychromonas sp. RZ22]TEW54308.1 hypothetical protein E2R68_08525 [Psychromonas sp. RZ22]